jgi:peptidoglycan/LPS O-acetylase OafA/YrhL
MLRVIWWIIVGLVLLTTLSGLWNGFQDWPHDENLGERLVTLAVIIYGLSGGVLLFAMLRKQKWIMIPLIVWSIALCFAGTVAPYVYSDEAKWISTIASGICMIALLLLIALQVKKQASSW